MRERLMGVDAARKVLERDGMGRGGTRVDNEVRECWEIRAR
jgi:hypothetical protein